MTGENRGGNGYGGWGGNPGGPTGRAATRANGPIVKYDRSRGTGLEDFTGQLGLWDRFIAQKADRGATRAMIKETIAAHATARMEHELFRMQLRLAEGKQTQLLDHQERMSRIVRVGLPRLLRVQLGGEAAGWPFRAHLK